MRLPKDERDGTLMSAETITDFPFVVKVTDRVVQECGEVMMPDRLGCCFLGPWLVTNMAVHDKVGIDNG